MKTFHALMVILDVFATVVFVSRKWLPGKNTINVTVLENLAFCEYPENLVQFVELYKGQVENA